MMTTDDTPRIWLGDLAAYNDGRLIGEWVDADDLDAMTELCDRMTHGGRSDYYIADHEGFGGYRVHEYANLERVAELAAAIVDHGADMVGAYFDCIGEDPDALDDMTDRFVGQFKDWEDFAMSDVNTWTDPDGTVHIGTELGGITVSDDTYVDWDAIGRDYNLGGCTYTGAERNGSLYVFTV